MVSGSHYTALLRDIDVPSFMLIWTVGGVSSRSYSSQSAWSFVIGVCMFSRRAMAFPIVETKVSLSGCVSATAERPYVMDHKKAVCLGVPVNLKQLSEGCTESDRMWPTERPKLRQ